MVTASSAPARRCSRSSSTGKGGRSRAASGRFFEEDAQEAITGSVVAERMDLEVGDVINPYHGLVFDEQRKHQDEYRVVGILEPTNSPSDRVVWIPIQGIYRMSGHVLRGSGRNFKPVEGEAIPDEHREVSAVMRRSTGARAGIRTRLPPGLVQRPGRFRLRRRLGRGCLERSRAG